MRIELSPAFQAAFPDGIFGALVARNCPNRLEAERVHVDEGAAEARLRERFPGEAIVADPIARAYAGYYHRHGGRYPVVHQARSILAGQRIGSASVLVEVLFTAELSSLVLTSGHDLHALAGPLLVDAARNGETFTRLSGKEQALKPGDMVVRDAEGVIACVVHGPDFRTRLRAGSDAVLFGAWCPTGVPGAVVDVHLSTLAQLLLKEWPGATVEAPRILSVQRAPLQEAPRTSEPWGIAVPPNGNERMGPEP